MNQFQVNVLLINSLKHQKISDILMGSKGNICLKWVNQAHACVFLFKSVTPQWYYKSGNYSCWYYMLEHFWKCIVFLSEPVTWSWHLLTFNPHFRVKLLLTCFHILGCQIKFSFNLGTAIYINHFHYIDREISSKSLTIWFVFFLFKFDIFPVHGICYFINGNLPSVTEKLYCKTPKHQTLKWNITAYNLELITKLVLKAPN